MLLDVKQQTINHSINLEKFTCTFEILLKVMLNTVNLKI